MFNHDVSFIESTIIDGDSLDAAVTFSTGETSDAIIMGFTIRGAFAQAGDRGGIYVHLASPTILYNHIIDNYVSGVFTGGSSSIIKGNYIARNSAMYVGGGIMCAIQGRPRIENNVIVDNFSAYNGGGLYFQDDTAIVANNTIVGNHCNYYGGGIYLNFAPGGNTIATMSNSICWSNRSLDSSQIYVRSGPASITVSYSDIQDGWQGLGNIDIEPAFRDTTNEDYRLISVACSYSSDSPCIDAGDPSSVDGLLDCQHGLGSFRSDMGAYGGNNLYLPTAIYENNSNFKPNNSFLLRNYPNPFNAYTVISYSIPSSTKITIDIVDILGREVKLLSEGLMPAGDHQAMWDARGQASGIYFYRIIGGNKVETKKMVLMK
jgi:hypothetical protein